MQFKVKTKSTGRGRERRRTRVNRASSEYCKYLHMYVCMCIHVTFMHAKHAKGNQVRQTETQSERQPAIQMQTETEFSTKATPFGQQLLPSRMQYFKCHLLLLLLLLFVFLLLLVNISFGQLE